MRDIAPVLLALAPSRPADAWINAKISVGVNWNWRTSNNFLFGGLVSACQNPYGILDAGPPPAHGFPAFSAAPQATTPNATGHGYSTASYGGSGNGFYNPASYQPSYYGSGYNTQPFALNYPLSPDSS